MKGLLIKEFLNLKGMLRQMLVVVLFMSVVWGPTSGATFMSPYLAIMCIMITMSTYSYDERCKWEKYALSMPLSRTDYLRSKYTVMILITLAAVLVGGIANVIVGSIFHNLNWENSLASAFAGLVIGIFFGSIMIPFLVHFGAEKARIYMMVIMVVPFALILFWEKIFHYSFSEVLQHPIMKNTPLLVSLGAIIFLGTIAISYFISLKIFLKKEF